MTDKEVMQMALDALESVYGKGKKCGAAIKALHTALAPPEPEPVAWFSKRPDNTLAIKIVGKPTEGDWEPLYTAPPQREWQGLTDEDIRNIAAQRTDFSRPAYEEYYIAIEAKLKEKNT